MAVASFGPPALRAEEEPAVANGDAPPALVAKGEADDANEPKVGCVFLGGSVVVVVVVAVSMGTSATASVLGAGAVSSLALDQYAVNLYL